MTDPTGVNPWIRTPPLVIAHRGQSLTMPEQTMVAYRAAIELGAAMIEADVRRTLDGELVMLHDEDLGRTTDGRGPVAQVRFGDLRGVDAGAWFHPRHAGERIPTLDELLDLADAARIPLCLEVKGESAAARATIAVGVTQRLADRGLLDRHVLASFDHDVLDAARRRHGELGIAPDRLPERGALTPQATVAQAIRIGAPILQHHHADLSPEVVAAAHDAGVAVWAWPTTDPADIERSIALGVDGVMGDDVPALVTAVRAA
ncbi:MAG TPA: glycerophosphodiester phosphodiesterase family protein [Vitreimonas sp.]|nr:glycerophosphodiester phosphodiesterase family protein [Vitreimonas sp.]